MLYVGLFTIVLIPAIMLLFGWLLAAPSNTVGKPNHFFGYRTKASMRSQQTWEFANRYCGRLWMKWSIPILAVSLAVFFLLDVSETAITVITLGQLLPMFITIWLTEQALKQEFDQNGNRRS